VSERLPYGQIVKEISWEIRSLRLGFEVQIMAMPKSWTLITANQKIVFIDDHLQAIGRSGV